MPNRLIKETICTSDKISALTDFNFRLWTCLIVYVDDFGRGDARAAIIKGRCFPLRDKVTPKDIDTGLQALADSGCIRLYKVDGQPFLCFPNWASHQSIRNQKSKYPSPDEADCDSEQIDFNCMQLKSIDCKSPRNPIQSESNPNPNPNPKTDAIASMFTRFWNEYPRHEAKQTAVKAFEKIKPDEALLETMIASIGRFKQTAQWQEDGGKYIPHPATWLNQRRWEDEPPKAEARYQKQRKDAYDQRPNDEPDGEAVPQWLQDRMKLA